jgi:hypothetical protein
VERELTEFLGKRKTIFKDESLEEFRLRIEAGTLSAYYNDDAKEQAQEECVGICSSMS